MSLHATITNAFPPRTSAMVTMTVVTAVMKNLVQKKVSPSVVMMLEEQHITKSIALLKILIMGLMRQGIVTNWA